MALKLSVDVINRMEADLDKIYEHTPEFANSLTMRYQYIAKSSYS